MQSYKYSLFSEVLGRQNTSDHWKDANFRPRPRNRHASRFLHCSVEQQRSHFCSDARQVLSIFRACGNFTELKHVPLTFSVKICGKHSFPCSEHNFGCKQRQFYSHFQQCPCRHVSAIVVGGWSGVRAIFEHDDADFRCENGHNFGRLCSDNDVFCRRKSSFTLNGQ